MKRAPWYERPLVDHLLVLMLVAGHFLLVRYTERFDLLAWGSAAHRRGLYQLLAGTASLLLTVGGSTIAIYVGAVGRRVSWYRRKNGEAGLSVIFSLIPALLLLVAVSVLGYVVDLNVGDGAFMRWLVEYAVLLTTWRVFRVLVIYRSVLGGKVNDANEEQHQRMRDELRAAG